MSDNTVISFTELIRWGLDESGLYERGEGIEKDFSAEFELADIEDQFVALQGRVSEVFRKIPVKYLPVDMSVWTDSEKQFFEQACDMVSEIHEAEDRDELTEVLKRLKEFLEKYDVEV